MILESDGTPEVIPRAPIGLSAQSAPGGVHLSWFPNLELDLSGYAVYRRAGGEPEVVRCATTPAADTAIFIPVSSSEVREYYITAIDSAGNESEPSDSVSGSPAVSVAESGHSLPAAFRLMQNFPNPANPATIIRFELPSASNVSLELYDMLGRKISTVIDGRREAGVHEVAVDGSALATGVYIYRLRSTDLSTGATLSDSKILLIMK